MKSRTKQRCEWLIQHLKEEGYSLQVPIREVKYEIADHLGGDQRTVSKYLQKVVEYGFMKVMNPSVMQFCDVLVVSPKVDGLEKFLVVDGEDEPP